MAGVIHLLLCMHKLIILGMNKRKAPASEDDSDDAPNQKKAAEINWTGSWEQAVAGPERYCYN
jgi:hypothetical protein